MVDVRSLINREKEKFKNYRNERTRTRIVSETARYQAEKQRQGEIARANAEKQAAKRDLEAIKGYNEKVEGPSKFKQFATRLSGAIEEAKAKQNSKAIPRRRIKVKKGKRGYSAESLTTINQGSQGLQFGSSGGPSPFEFNTKKQDKKNNWF